MKINNDVLLRVAIIGCGPRGTYAFRALQELIVKFSLRKELNKLEIYLFEETGNFGSGWVYNPEQPLYLRINSKPSSINVWLEDSNDTPCLVNWLENFRNPPFKVIDDNHMIPRAYVGEYYCWAFKEIRNRYPNNCDIIMIDSEASSVVQKDDAYYISYVDSLGRKSVVHDVYSIFLATGHTKQKPDYRFIKNYDQCFDSSKQQIKNRCMLNVYPVERKIVPHNFSNYDTIGIFGLGNTFVDVILSLTIGKGGKFQTCENTGKTKYIRSGKEPAKIIAFSKSGYLYAPKAIIKDRVKFLPRFFNYDNETYKSLKERALNSKLDFKNDILTLLILEMKDKYYSTYFRIEGASDRLWNLFNRNETFYQAIEQFHFVHSNAKRFDFDDLFSPFSKIRFVSSETFKAENMKLIKKQISEAKLGSQLSPEMAAIDVWKGVRGRLIKLIEFGGLRPESEECFLNYYSRVFERRTLTPVVNSLEKILCLVNEGILQFPIASNPSLSYNESNNCFDLHSMAYSAEVFRLDLLICAWVPAFLLDRTESSLLSSMNENGLIRKYVNMDPDTSSIKLHGGIDVSKEDGATIDANGKKTRIYASGILGTGAMYGQNTLKAERNSYYLNWADCIIKQLAPAEVNSL